ncbi:hypothetical protein HRJ34_05190 [Rhizorhabdus wittichii]|uniref:Uncharacterized protein n=1 Tax=Rhizorhabdus wittichii TaxID=160791 RepID=A0A975D4K0_9SPHN|nr:hypothetical protein [Rhizorhabdus wittichii]QTH22912.1 hypothetical protein HRJ34_05190 [Rhizorhabdus wittichii]
MPLQNRVTPFGDIVAIDQRGLFTGNRGILHDPATRTLGKRRWTSKAWLICTCDYRDRRRAVMGGRSWTELFFLDEAVALAAGHRPCFLCRRPAALRFREAWAAGQGLPQPSAGAMDAVLHAERIGRRAHPAPGRPIDLPDGTMVANAGAAFLLHEGLARCWTDRGYGPPEPLPRAERLLTPPSTVAALRAGYRVVVHPSVETGHA